MRTALNSDFTVLAGRGPGEGVSDSDKLAYLKNGNGAIDRSFAFPKRFLNDCQRQFKAKWLDEYQWLTYSTSEDGGEKKKVSVYHTLTEVVVKTPVLGSWSRSLWPTGQELQQPWRRTLSAKCTARVFGTLHSCKRKTPVLQELHEMIRHGWTDRAYLKILTKIGQNLLILDTICKNFYGGKPPDPRLPKIEPSSVPLGLRPWKWHSPKRQKDPPSRGQFAPHTGRLLSECPWRADEATHMAQWLLNRRCFQMLDKMREVDRRHASAVNKTTTRYIKSQNFSWAI